MASIIFKDCSVRLRLKTAGEYYRLKGHSELNILSDELLRELLECNSELREWVDRGYAVINGNVDNVKQDAHLEMVKATEEREKKAVIEAEETIKKTSKKKRL